MGKNCLEWVAAMPPSLGGAGGSCYCFPSGQTQTGVPTIPLRDKEKSDYYRRLFIHSRFACCVVPTQDLLLPQASKWPKSNQRLPKY
ncbi:Protein adenylyltransferase FICD [Trichinella spiralis]|uniref:Protein adenylyltransferase FICD n=1 Tax=Trichinella spiralis TaxID=6334 RepID=A0ABR3K7C2_TRISP